MHHTPLRILIVVLLAILLVAPATSGAPTAPPVSAPTLASYQGHVFAAGAPYSGNGYFKFAVIDGAGDTWWSNDGTGSGQPAASVKLAVTNGLFSVLLGDTSLEGMKEPLEAADLPLGEAYLRVWFSGDDIAFTQLADRRIGSAPYALVADQAATAGDAGLLDGLDSTAFQRHYAGVIVVAKSGGDFTTITAALNSVTGSASNRYLVWVAPGDYNEQVVMEPYVDIAGAGERTTVITYGGTASPSVGTVMGADNAELRDLTVRNTGDYDYANAIVNSGSSPRLTRVTAEATGEAEDCCGVRNYYSYAVMTDVTASAFCVSSTNNGVYNESSSPVMTRVTASASSALATRGVYNTGGTPTMVDVTARATGSGSAITDGVLTDSASTAMTNVTASATGGLNCAGVRTVGASAPQMTEVVATASGCSAINAGVSNTNAAVTMTEVTAKATGGTAGEAYGVYNQSNLPTMTEVTAEASCNDMCRSYGLVNWQSNPTIVRCTFIASGTGTRTGISNGSSTSSTTYYVDITASQVIGSGNTINNGAWFATRVRASMLDGGNVVNSGSITCSGNYDEGFTFYASTCP